MTIQQAYQQLLQQLYEVYEQREAANIADIVIEKVTGQRKTDRIIYKDLPVNTEQQSSLRKILSELLQHKPVQYAIGEAWFAGIKLFVNEHVLIPRPETEELAEWIIQDIQACEYKDISLLDIGTGSGCIPIAIKKKIPAAEVTAADVSEDALQVAKINSAEQNLPVDFLHADILEPYYWEHFGHYNIIVSNPPYVKRSEQAGMRKNVVDYEPHLALFVADNNALVFYKAIAMFSRTHLKEGGHIYVEINEALAAEVMEIFNKNDFANLELRRDIYGKDRMIKAGK